MKKIFISLVIVMSFTFWLPHLVKAVEPPKFEAQRQKKVKENSHIKELADRQSEIVNTFLHKNGELFNVDIPRLIIKGFSDFGFYTTITDNNSSSTFALGMMDLFITSEITDRINFLAEIVSYPEENSLDIYIARTNLRYSISDLLSIKIGKIHTSLGYWNQAYHHGTWLQTTIFRPVIYNWEIDGGILPLHSVGIELFGMKALNLFDLEYNFVVANGRGRTITEVQNVEDMNDSKAINILLNLKPNFVNGFRFGSNFYIDRIPSNPTDSTRTKEIDELILGGYATYFNDRFELIGEFFNIHHDDKTSGRNINTSGLYLQGGLIVDKLTAYYRFDFIDFEKDDPYFTPNDSDIKKHTLGLRWDIFTWNAIKVEYSLSERNNNDSENIIVLNSSFTF